MQNMKNLVPKSPIDFTSELKLVEEESKIDFEDYFSVHIKNAIDFVIGPYFWLIPNQFEMKIVSVSPNIKQLTPYDKDEWIGKNPEFFALNFHPEDRLYILSAIFIAIETAEKTPINNKLRINIYGRMLNQNHEYKWRLIQFPAFYIGESGRVESGLILITDISHLNFQNQPLMTIIDSSDSENQFFKVNVESKKFIPLTIPKISKREQEILSLIAKGLNTPQIAAQLFIAYNTVENHKKNLRQKTNTKTTAELIRFVFEHNLL
jgi:DNA-binding CsgD family transcriptional regulator